MYHNVIRSLGLRGACHSEGVYTECMQVTVIRLPSASLQACSPKQSPRLLSCSQFCQPHFFKFFGLQIFKI